MSYRWVTVLWAFILFHPACKSTTHKTARGKDDISRQVISCYMPGTNEMLWYTSGNPAPLFDSVYAAASHAQGVSLHQHNYHFLVATATVEGDEAMWHWPAGACHQGK